MTSPTQKHVNKYGFVLVDTEQILLAHTAADYRHSEERIHGGSSKPSNTFTSVTSTVCTDPL